MARALNIIESDHLKSRYQRLWLSRGHEWRRNSQDFLGRLAAFQVAESEEELGAPRECAPQFRLKHDDQRDGTGAPGGTEAKPPWL